MRSMKNAAVLMEDGEFALILRPHPREFAISRGEKSANARGSGPDGGGGGGGVGEERLAQLALTNALYPQGAGHLNLAKTSSSKSNGSRCEQGIRYKPGLYIFQRRPVLLVSCGGAWGRQVRGRRKTREMGRVIKAIQHKIQHGDLSLRSSVSSAADFTVL